MHFRGLENITYLLKNLKLIQYICLWNCWVLDMISISISVRPKFMILVAILNLCKLEGQIVKIISRIHHFLIQHAKLTVKVIYTAFPHICNWNVYISELDLVYVAKQILPYWLVYVHLEKYIGKNPLRFTVTSGVVIASSSGQAPKDKIEEENEKKGEKFVEGWGKMRKCPTLAHQRSSVWRYCC